MAFAPPAAESLGVVLTFGTIDVLDDPSWTGIRASPKTACVAKAPDKLAKYSPNAKRNEAAFNGAIA